LRTTSGRALQQRNSHTGDAKWLFIIYEPMDVFAFTTCYLGEQVVDHMSSNVVVDLVEDTVITIQSGKASSQVAPLLKQRAALHNI
jgi:hypothetical protein